MATHRRPVRTTSGVRFAKLLGTSASQGFSRGDADPHTWGLLTTWDSVPAADRFAAGRVAGQWSRSATDHLHVRLRPLASQGRWSRREPFGRPEPQSWVGPTAAITRARLDRRLARRFWAAVPAVNDTLRASPGLLLAIGIGEAPVGLTGTVSLWASAADLRRFAYDSPAHQAAIRDTRRLGWYAEELFARFAVTSVSGTWHGAPLPVPAYREGALGQAG
jgi:hypothetical protein